MRICARLKDALTICTWFPRKDYGAFTVLILVPAVLTTRRPTLTSIDKCPASLIVHCYRTGDAEDLRKVDIVDKHVALGKRVVVGRRGNVVAHGISALREFHRHFRPVPNCPGALPVARRDRIDLVT